MIDLFSALNSICESKPATIATFSRAGFVHYGAFGRNIEHSARYALGCSIRPGNLVVIRTANPDVRLQIALGLMRLGCCVGIAQELGDYESHGVKVDWIVTDDPKAPKAPRTIPIDMKWFFTGSPYRPVPLPEDPDFSLVFASSGSTGRTKLMKMSKVGLMHRIESKSPDSYFNDSPRFLAGAGDSTSTTMQDSLVVLLKGGTIFRPFGRDAMSILDTVQAHRPDYVTISPATLVALLHILKETPANLQKVRMIRLAGAYCSPEVQSEALDLFAENIVMSYGATEIGRVAWGYFSDIRLVPGSVGRIKDDVEVVTVDADGQVLPPGTEGELRIKVPPGVPISYAGSGPQAKTFDGNWFIPGDLGRVDENRNLIVIGRSSLVINLGGTKVSPEAIEEALAQYAAIKDIGVAGIAGPNGFQQVHAAVVCRDPIDLNRLNQYLAQKQSRLGIHVIKTVDSIPRGANGKINRVALRELLDG